jgi:phage shock protein PspC (stress-responsive transcriptional regulator)
MSLADDLERLQAMRAAGTLSDDEFVRAKARLLGDAPAAPPPAFAEVNKLRRSRSDRWLGGVCGGLAALSGVDAWIWRLLVTVLALFGGTGVVIYALLWIFVPNE